MNAMKDGVMSEGAPLYDLSKTRRHGMIVASRVSARMSSLQLELPYEAVPAGRDVAFTDDVVLTTRLSDLSQE